MNKLPENEELRAYHFGNFYMSSIQQGIQAAHAQTEAGLKYLKTLENGLCSEIFTKQKELYIEWATKHKTMICLNGGDHKSLTDIVVLMAQNKSYPWACFHESNDALNGMLTNVMIILPKRIYDTGCNLLRDRRTQYTSIASPDGNLDYEFVAFNGERHYYSEFEFKLMSKMNECSLAR